MAWKSIRWVFSAPFSAACSVSTFRDKEDSCGRLRRLHSLPQHLQNILCVFLCVWRLSGRAGINDTGCSVNGPFQDLPGRLVRAGGALRDRAWQRCLAGPGPDSYTASQFSCRMCADRMLENLMFPSVLFGGYHGGL